MTSSLRDAFNAALIKHDDPVVQAVAGTEPMRQTVGEWSADDTVHVDPPINRYQPPSPAPIGPPAKFDPSQPVSTKGMGKGITGRTQPRNSAGNHFLPSNNVSRETFDYIKAHDGTTRIEAINALGARGFNKGSVSSLIGQMMMQEMVKRDDDGRLHVLTQEFSPLKSGKYREALLQAKGITVQHRKPQPTPAPVPASTKPPAPPALDLAHRQAPPAIPNPNEGLEEIVRQHATVAQSTQPAPTSVLDLRNMEPDDIVNSLGLMQARKLYLKLKEYFTA